MRRSRLSLAVAAAAIALVASPAVTPAQITLSQDFDSGSLNVGGSSINTTGAQPVISLAPRYTFEGNWWWMNFRATGLAGTTPQFSVPTANHFQGLNAQNRYVYSYDRENWSFFDQGTVSGGAFRFQNNNAFTGGEVFVAAAIPYPVSQTVAHTASLKSSPFVRDTLSSDADFLLGRTLGTAGGGYVDSSSRPVAAQDVYAYNITDPAVPDAGKRNVVLLGGNHSGESTGNWALQGLVDFLVSDDAAAAELRQRANVFVYPQSDPEGRAAGYFRSNPQNPTRNHNRVWHQPEQPGTYSFPEVTMIRNAMAADTGGQADVFLDFHSFGSGTDVGYFLRETNPTSSAFLRNLRGYEPGVRDLGTTDGEELTSTHWGMTTLGAKIAMSPEFGFLSNQGVGRYAELGERYGLALLDTIKAGAFDPPQPRRSDVFNQQVAALQPVMHLRLNEAAGAEKAVDSAAAGGNNEGTYVNAVQRGMADPFDADAAGTAVQFGGDDAPGYVRVGRFKYSNASNHFSLAFWFNTTNITGSGSQYIFSHGTVFTQNSLNVFLVEEENSGQGNRLRTAFADSNDPASAFTDIQPAGADGLWHLYSLVVDAAGAHVYFDGELIATRAVGGDTFFPAGDIFIATRNDVAVTADRYYGFAGDVNGLLDEVMLFDRALTADQVRSLYTSVPEPSALVAAGAVAIGAGLRRRRRRGNG